MFVSGVSAKFHHRQIKKSAFSLMDYKYTKIKLFKLGHHSSYLTVRSPLINSFVRNEIINFCFSCFSCLNKMKNFLFGFFFGSRRCSGKRWWDRRRCFVCQKNGNTNKEIEKKEIRMRCILRHSYVKANICVGEIDGECSFVSLK